MLQKINTNASNIDYVTTNHPSKIIIESAFGGKRLVNPLIG